MLHKSEINPHCHITNNNFCANPSANHPPRTFLLLVNETWLHLKTRLGQQRCKNFVWWGVTWRNPQEHLCQNGGRHLHRNLWALALGNTVLNLTRNLLLTLIRASFLVLTSDVRVASGKSFLTKSSLLTAISCSREG